MRATCAQRHVLLCSLSFNLEYAYSVSNFLLTFLINDKFNNLYYPWETSLWIYSCKILCIIVEFEWQNKCNISPNKLTLQNNARKRRRDICLLKLPVPVEMFLLIKSYCPPFLHLTSHWVSTKTKGLSLLLMSWFILFSDYSRNQAHWVMAEIWVEVLVDDISNN